jgi:hypothetical protein
VVINNFSIAVELSGEYNSLVVGVVVLPISEIVYCPFLPIRRKAQSWDGVLWWGAVLDLWCGTRYPFLKIPSSADLLFIALYQRGERHVDA